MRREVGAHSPYTSEIELTDGIPVFLDQLCDALSLRSSSAATDHDAIKASATKYGLDLLRLGLSVAQVVRHYGEVCQIVTALIAEQNVSITADEFRTLNLCLDDAIANAVTAYASQHDQAIAKEETERLGMLSHELRNEVNVALLAFESIKTGVVTASGSTGAMLARSLLRLRSLVDRSLSEVRLDSGIERFETVAVKQLIDEVEISASIVAREKGISLKIHRIDPKLTIEADPQILASAVSNLVQNAIKFTQANGHVCLTVRATEHRVAIDVEDECGGLPPGKAEDLFRPFEQRSGDRTGLGLGLFISAKAAKANGGLLHVRDLPGKGCVFTLDLLRKQTSTT